jgi:hypothetical protein
MMQCCETDEARGVIENEEEEEEEEEGEEEEEDGEEMVEEEETHHPVNSSYMSLQQRVSSQEHSIFEQEKEEIVRQLEKSSWITARYYQKVNQRRPKLPVNFLRSSVSMEKQEEDDPTLTRSEVLITIQFHHVDQIGKKTHEYLVLGHQALTMLRDVIECRWNHVMGEPYIPDSFFLIENTFYSDMRHPSAVDLSKSLREWADEKRKEDASFPTFAMHRMEDIMFVDLTIRLNVPYLYVHQGTCEHVFVISDIRLMHTKDNHDMKAYPQKSFCRKMSRRMCTMCRLCPAKHYCW